MEYENVYITLGNCKLPLAQYAKLRGKLVLAGMYKRIEIWNEEAWNECMETSAKDANQVAETLSSIGVL